MSLDKTKFLKLIGTPEAQQFMRSMENDSSENMFAALEPQSRKIEAFLNDIEDEIANGGIKDADFAKGYLTGLMSRHELYLGESEQKLWLDNLMGFKPISVNPDSFIDYPPLLVPDGQPSSIWPSLKEKLKGGIPSGELITILGSGSVGNRHAELISAINKQPDFIVSSEFDGAVPSEIAVKGLKTFHDKIALDGFAHNDFIIRGQDNVPELQAFDAKDRNRFLHSTRADLTPIQRNKRKSKNKAASKARRKARK